MKEEKNNKIIKIKSKAELKIFANDIATLLKKGSVIALSGDLGAGKTTFTQYLAEAIGVSEHVSSPTYTILKEYYSGNLPVYHFDAYRILDAGEFLDLDIDEYLYGTGISVIEWAENIKELLPEDTIWIEISIQNNGERIYKCTF